MLTLITGTPGSGKTLYTVSSIIPEYSAQTVTLGDKQVPRRILVDGVKDLVIEHEMLAPTSYNALADKCECDGEGLLNWWAWCKPGDVIVIDEVQRIWRPRGNGSKVPQMIAELETHRHRGVDFVLITQHPMLLDQNVRRLVSRHIHIRRMWGGSRAVRYEWDHCSAPDRVSDAGKSYWPYPKDAYKYYKSAEVHTRQGGKVPAALLIMALAFLALPAVAYYAVTRATGVLHGETATIAKEASKATQAPGQAVGHVDGGTQKAPGESKESAPPAPLPAPVQVASATVAPVHKVGCIATRTTCKCMDETGATVDPSPEMCMQTGLEKTGLLPLGVKEYHSREQLQSQAQQRGNDDELREFLDRRKAWRGT